jgi:diguanylate cyclase (GGDEF)-like protein
MLAVVVLLPTAGMAVLATSTAAPRWSERSATAQVSRDAVAMQRLIVFRGEITTENVQSAALASAADYGLSPAQLSALYGIDFTGLLELARRRVDADTTWSAFPELAGDRQRLTRLRSEIDAGHAGFASVDKFFAPFAVAVDQLWQRHLDAARDLIDNAGTRGSDHLQASIDAAETTFAAFRAAQDRTRYTNNLLLGRNTPANVEALIEANTRFADAVARGNGRLGPKASTAWQALERDPAARRFEAVIAQTVEIGLTGARSPFATQPTAYGAALTDGGRWIIDLADVNGAASSDLNDVARDREASATRAFLAGLFAAAALAALASVIAALTARSVSRPASRLATSARRISKGEFSVPPLRPHGPRELAETARALNDLTATLAALERYAVTLAADPRAPILDLPLPGRTGQALQVAMDHLRDSIHEREQHRLELQEMATHDGLTGLLNRTAAMDALTRDLSRSERDGTPMMALFLDLDAFKGINDSYGHEVGDDALRLIADALRATTRASDVVARLGGDEFLVSGFAVEGAADVEVFARRVHEAIASRSLSPGGQHLRVSCSIGVAVTEAGDTADSLVRKADGALYLAKQRGPDHVVFSGARVAQPTT